MKFIKTDYFNWDSDMLFDAIITDPPYKDAFKNQLNEENLNYNMMFSKFSINLKDVAAVVMFSNFMQIPKIIPKAEEYGFKLHCYQVWDKSPTRNWIAWSYPLRTTEFILYFSKGKYKYSFKDGTEKPRYKRSSFGTEFIQQKESKNEVSYGMYEDILRIPNRHKKKIHPTQKPIEFSSIFKQILGDIDVLDPFCGSGNLIKTFTNGIGIDIINWEAKYRDKKNKQLF